MEDAMNDAGKAFFTENKNLFSDPKTAPEKFNLYNGLLSMSLIINDISSKLDKIHQELEDLKNKLHQRGHI
jgi:hypothetical protein